MDRAFVTFEDVAIYFTRREWEMLNERQKSLYKEVMNDNYQMILSLNRPDIILNIDLGCEPYVQSHSESTGSWQEKNSDDRSSSHPCCTDTMSSSCEPQVKRQRRYPRVNPFRWIKKDKKRKRRFNRASHRISRRTVDKKTLSGDYEVKTSLERSHCDSSTCISQDSANNIQDEPIPIEPFMNRGESKDLNSEEWSDDGSDAGTDAECSHLEEVISTCEKQEDVLERSERFTADTKNCEKPREGSGLSPKFDCSHREDDIDPGLDGAIPDSKDLPAFETSDILMGANSVKPRKMGTPKTEIWKEERRSPTTKKKASHHKKDRHVKFNEVVTMILIEKKSEERSIESLESEGMLQSTRLPIFNNVNEEGNKKKEVKCSTRHDIEERTSQGRGILHRSVEGTKQKRKRKTVSSCQAEEVESCPSSTPKCSKKIVKVMGTSQRARELKALSPTKKKARHELHSAEMNEFRNLKSEDRMVDTGSGLQPNPPLNNHEQKLIKFYSCSNCGKVTHWSKLSVHQKESIESSIAHMCRMCGLQTSTTSAIVPAQTICPPPFTISSRSGEMSQPVNRSKISACSSAQPNAKRIFLAEKKQTQNTDGNNKTTQKPGNLTTANHQKTGANNDQFKKPPQISQHNNESKVCSKCENLGAPLDPKLKTFTASSASNTSFADTSSPSLDSNWRRIGTKNKVASIFSADQPQKTGDSREHEICAKCGKCLITEQRNDPSSSEQQKKLTTNSPSLLQKTQEHHAVLKKCSSYTSNTKKPRCMVNHEGPKSDKDCTDYGKSLSMHVTVNPKNPGEGVEKNCVLRLKKKQERLLEEMDPLDGLEPYKCKQCGKVFTRHFSLLQHCKTHSRGRPYSCKECGKFFSDAGYIKVHMRLHTKERPYTCSECGKSFCQKPALVVHLRTHTDEKPFQCSVCRKSFSDRSTLRHHKFIHTGEKPFTCSFCGKKFTQQAHVKRHEKMHTGERPFGCTVCEKRFIDRPKLRKHELTHNRGKIQEPKN